MSRFQAPLVGVHGVSGSGKRSLIVSTIAAESQRLINETCSAFVQGFMLTLASPEVDSARKADRHHRRSGADGIRHPLYGGYSHRPHTPCCGSRFRPDVLSRR